MNCGKSSNVFLDLGFSPEEATILAMRSQLMGELRIKIRDMGWTQAEAAQVRSTTPLRATRALNSNKCSTPSAN